MQRGGRAGQSGQATVEFALASLFFLLFTFGTIDFGRAIFIESDLQNAVREGSHYAAIKPTDSAGAKAKVVAKAPRTGLTTSGVTWSCTGTCITGEKVTVSASVQFRAVTQTFLGIPAVTLHASSTADVE